jgi:hypothetical protein
MAHGTSIGDCPNEATSFKALCDAFGTRAFPAGATVNFSLEWGGEIWDDGQGKLVPASDGTDEWARSFRAYESADGGNLTDLSLHDLIWVGQA